MSGYKLRAGHPEFEIVDGPQAGRRFVRGEIYPEPPAGHEHAFEPAEKAAAVVPLARPARPARRPPVDDETA